MSALQERFRRGFLGGLVWVPMPCWGFHLWALGYIGFRGRNKLDKDLAVLSQRPFTTSCGLEGLRLDAKGGGSC